MSYPIDLRNPELTLLTLPLFPFLTAFLAMSVFDEPTRAVNVSGRSMDAD